MAVSQSIIYSVLVLVLLGATASASPPVTSECECRHAPPIKNNPPLRFCNWYPSASCCLPAHDFDINSKFLAFIEAGPTCEKYQNKAKLFLAMAFCYGCDPEEPGHFGPPLNTRFFDPTRKTAKICRGIADQIAPERFDECGLTLPDDRETICSPNSAVVPSFTWPECANGEYVCQSRDDQNWYCSATQCGTNSTPLGFADVPCNKTEQTCSGALKLLNDNRAAKPPYFEEYAVEIVDETLCLQQHTNASRCKCLKPANVAGASASHQRIQTTSRSVSLIVTIVVVFGIYA